MRPLATAHSQRSSIASAASVWCCLPRFDGDPVFCDLLNEDQEDGNDRQGVFEIEVDDLSRSEQEYLTNTAVLVTRLFDSNGSAIEITDFAPRFGQFGRMFRPMSLVRTIRPIKGNPRIRIKLRPRSDYGATTPSVTHGSNHIRYVGTNVTLRLTTDAPPAYILDETPFFLEDPVALVLGPDETLTRAPGAAAHEFLERTREYWRDWVRHLALPLEWQDAVIRAAITIKLCSFEETGAIVAGHDPPRFPRRPTAVAIGTTGIAGCGTPSWSCVRSTVSALYT